jgi:hypothetical protein
MEVQHMSAYDPTTGMATQSGTTETSSITETPDTAGSNDTAGMSGTAGFGADPSSYEGSTNESEGQRIAQTARQVAEGVAGAAGEVTARIPEVAQSARGAWEEADRMVHRGSDSTLQLVGAASVGFAVGLLVGGAHRLLVILSLIPAALIGATMVERMERGESWSDVVESDTLVQGR